MGQNQKVQGKSYIVLKMAVKFLYYVLKNNIERFREAASGMGENGQTLEELLCNVIEYEAKNKINSSK